MPVNQEVVVWYWVENSENQANIHFFQYAVSQGGTSSFTMKRWEKKITGLSEVLQVTKTWFRMQIWVYREESIQAGWIISTLVKSETTSSNCLLLQPCPLLHSKCASVSVHCVPQRGWGLPAACQLRATTCEQADKAGTQTHRRPFLFFQ